MGLTALRLSIPNLTQSWDYCAAYGGLWSPTLAAGQLHNKEDRPSKRVISCIKGLRTLVQARHRNPFIQENLRICGGLSSLLYSVWDSNPWFQEWESCVLDQLAEPSIVPFWWCKDRAKIQTSKTFAKKNKKIVIFLQKPPTAGAMPPKGKTRKTGKIGRTGRTRTPVTPVSPVTLVAPVTPVSLAPPCSRVSFLIPANKESPQFYISNSKHYICGVGRI